nr:MAG TPA: hypothetical protein [Caudoviricetes sp.]
MFIEGMKKQNNKRAAIQACSFIILKSYCHHK